MGDPEARRQFKKYLRYCVARWGYSPNIQSWELFREVDHAAGYYQKDSRAVLTTLLSDLAMYMHALDTHHMVGTSTSYEDPPRDILNAAGLDYLQPHQYVNRPGYSRGAEQNSDALTAAEVNMPELHASLAEAYRTEFRDAAGNLNEFSGMDVPLIIGEYGRSRGAGDAFTPEYAQNMAIWVHNQTWATLFSGSAGIPMAWDSCYILLGQHWINDNPSVDTDVWEDIMSPHYQALTDFIQKIDFIGSDFQVVYPQVSFSSPPQAGYDNYSFNPWRLGNETAEDDAFQVPMPGLVSPSEFSARISPWLGTQGWCALSENPDWNPPVFTVSSAETWTLRLKFNRKEGGDMPQQLRLMVNGSMLDPTDIAVGATYHSWPNMPAGDCTVKIENVTSGNYALRVGDPANDPDPDHAGFHFEGTVSPLRVYALVGSNTIIAWVHNRKYNIMDTMTWNESEGKYEFTAPDPIEHARILFTGLGLGSTWTATWWDTRTGEQLDPGETYTVREDGAQTNEWTLRQEAGGENQPKNMVGSILWDAALIMTKNP
jgi:hypothetical protein